LLKYQFRYRYERCLKLLENKATDNSMGRKDKRQETTNCWLIHLKKIQTSNKRQRVVGSFIS